MIYYGSRISDNLSTSPEGFLICHNVPIARTGYQDYLGSEFPQEMQEEYGIDPQKIYKVYRSKEEVFSPATIASFEGKPFTDSHPSEMVTTQNIGMYGKGHIQNIRKGDGEYKDMLTADIICTDEIVANTVKEKLKREVSCGYDYVMEKGSKGFEQTHIRGNHLALVGNGRAGQKAAIQDSIPDAIIKQKMKGETNMAKINKSFLAALGFKHFVADAEPEEINQALTAMGSDEDPEASTNEGGNSIEKDVADLKAAMAEISSALKQLIESGKESGLSDEDKLNSLENETTDELENPESEGISIIEPEKEEITDEEPEEVEKPQAMDAAMKGFVKAMKPVLLSIPDEKVRTKAVDAFVAAAKDAIAPKPADKNGYSALIKAVNSNAKTKDSKLETMDQRRSEQVNTINKYNPHLKKEEK